MSIKTVASKQRDVVLEFKWQIETGAVNINDMIQAIIDVLEDRSLLTVSQKVEENKEDIEQLDKRVTNTEDDVKVLDSKVDNQQKDLDIVKLDVNEQGERLDDLEEVVDETIEKVEEIDHKTLSSAPAWSRDVSLLLNPESDSDWRFIAIRLGYSPEDIRNWATAHDPTMSMLSEWYTTHKSSDATYAVLTSLKELGRNDCADVIEKALKDADQAVPGPPPEMTHPPPIFISYQWDHQSEIKAIRTHLEMAGYECWMDIGQMGGGDKLYEKIDEGLRGAKVVLSMCTSKYAQSKNCNHEVNLASLLNKPIIPIILEDMPWPPPGAMSMLFSQLLYIDFKSDQGTKAGEKFWTDAKFSELLGQITYYVAPDPEKIADEYKNWVPKVEEPASKPKDSSKTNNMQTTKLKKDTPQEPEVVDPEVFISYQWDKQPEVKKLYGKLADLGFTCWLDINQMGGGDALYGKIDRGVRKAKVVVSCVTTKYALSANCRREVSLSDALHKPIIPILLEETAWPPEGPMSMPFAQLLYIDFTRQNSQQFNDDKFKELLSKLRQYSEPIKLDSSSEKDVNTLDSVNTGDDLVPVLAPEQGSEYHQEDSCPTEMELLVSDKENKKEDLDPKKEKIPEKAQGIDKKALPLEQLKTYPGDSNPTEIELLESEKESKRQNLKKEKIPEKSQETDKNGLVLEQPKTCPGDSTTTEMKLLESDKDIKRPGAGNLQGKAEAEARQGSGKAAIRPGSSSGKRPGEEPAARMARHRQEDFDKEKIPEKSQGMDKNGLDLEQPKTYPGDSNSTELIEAEEEVDNYKETIPVLDEKDYQNTLNPNADQNIISPHYKTTSNSTTLPQAHNNPSTNNNPTIQQPAKKSKTCNLL